jgi:hypothetical protein
MLYQEFPQKTFFRPALIHFDIPIKLFIMHVYYIALNLSSTILNLTTIHWQLHCNWRDRLWMGVVKTWSHPELELSRAHTSRTLYDFYHSHPDSHLAIEPCVSSILCFALNFILRLDDPYWVNSWPLIKSMRDKHLWCTVYSVLERSYILIQCSECYYIPSNNLFSCSY